MTSKKRTFDKQESAKSIALRELEEAKEAVKQAQEKVVQEITKEACHDFKQTMQTTHEARKKIDYAFTHCISYKQSFIATTRDGGDVPWFQIHFFDINEKRDSAYLSPYTYLDFVANVADFDHEDDDFDFLLEYTLILLIRFLKSYHAKLSEHIQDLVPMEQIYKKLKDFVLGE